MAPHVVTVLGERPASSLGVVDAHDHLFLSSPALAGQELTDPDGVAAEVREGAASGIATIVEMTPIGLGRRPDLMRALSESTGVAVIAASGYHRDAHYPSGHWVHEAPVSELAQRIVMDLTVGMHPADWLDPALPLSPARAGVVKAGTSYHRISPGEHRRLEAAAIGARAAGVPVLVHAEVGTGGHAIVDALEAAGLAPDRVILAHMDRNPDAELHAELCARGVSLEYDTVGRTKYHPDSTLLDLVEAVVAAGHLDRLMLGLDLGLRDYFRAFGGGPGMRYLMDTFVPRLRRRLGDDAVRAILETNPGAVFAVREASA